MDTLLVIGAVFLLIYVLWDMFITVFSTDGAGPFTRFWSDRLWSGLLVIHRRRRIHGVLLLTGPLVLLATILLWYFLLGTAIFMLLATSAGSVVDSTTGAEANLVEKLYFVSTTISSLGYGEWVPAGPPWTFVSTLSTLAATVVLTISLSYVLAVLGAAIDRRALAQGVFSMGDSVRDIIDATQLDCPSNSLKPYVLNLSSQITHQALRHLAYPVLKYFHAARSDLSPARAMLLLADSFFMMNLLPEERRPPPGIQKTVMSSISSFATRTMSGVARRPDDHRNHLLATARSCGIDLPQPEIESALGEYLPLRADLVALCREDGWAIERT